MSMVSIIIVNYNSSHFLAKCIESIYLHTSNVEYEIIVVDNASPNDKAITNFPERFPAVKFVFNNNNIGFAGANNLGVKYATGKFVFFLNPDTVLLTNAIFILSDYLKHFSNVGIVGANLYREDMKPNFSYSHFSPGFIQSFNQLTFNRLNMILNKNDLFNTTKKPLRVDGFVSGAALMIRANIFHELNGFDEDFFLYYEETELTYRVRKKKYLIYNNPDAKIIHLEGQSESIRDITFQRMKQSESLYYAKTNKRYMNFLSFVFAFLSDAILYFYYSISRNIEKKRLVSKSMSLNLKYSRKF